MATNKPPKKGQPRKQARQRGRWNTSEILYAAFFYLQNRPVPLLLGKNHGQGPVAKIIDEIIRVNGLPATRVKYPPIQTSEYMDALTNERPRFEEDGVMGMMRNAQPRPDEAEEILQSIMKMPEHRRLETLRFIVDRVKMYAEGDMERLRNKVKEFTGELSDKGSYSLSLRAVLSGT